MLEELADKKQNKAREEIVNLFVDCLEKEDLPWHQGFYSIRTSFNPITNTTYKKTVIDLFI